MYTDKEIKRYLKSMNEYERDVIGALAQSFDGLEHAKENYVDVGWWYEQIEEDIRSLKLNIKRGNI